MQSLTFAEVKQGEQTQNKDHIAGPGDKIAVSHSVYLDVYMCVSVCMKCMASQTNQNP